MEEETKPQSNGLPESPASINTRIKTPNGFIVQWTMRDESNKNLLFKLKTMEDYWLKNGYTPVEDRKTGFPPKEKDYVEGRVCPQCGSKLVKSVTKTGKNLIKCETNKWNVNTRQAEGCQYVQWEDNEQAS